MGFFSQSLSVLVPERKAAIGSAIPTWQDQTPQYPQSSYERNAREGYMLDELVFSCVEFRATSAGEPPICAYVKVAGGEEKLEEHPAITLLNNPNPFMGRSRFWSTLLMHEDVGGNAYVEKVRSGSGKVVELWPLRPDRMRVIPDRQKYIGGYSYTIGTESFRLPAEDVIHFKTRHPLDDFYGLPPLAVLAGRVDLDVWVRRFTEAFFRNAGVPAGLINLVRVMNETEREQVRRRFRELYGGSEGWHRLLVLDGAQASYTPMGLPMGANGLAMADLTEINEAKILSAFGMKGSLLATRIGSSASSYANQVSDRELFWESTMIPIFRDLDSALSTGLASEYPDIDRLEHDLSKVKALAEDEDKKHGRARDDFKAGITTWREARMALGLPAEPDEPGIVVMPTTMVPTWSDEMLVEPPPEPVMPALPPGTPGANGVAAGRNGAVAH